MDSRGNKFRRSTTPIVEYSGLSQFMDVPLKNYSSGMVVRLAFAVAANLDPDLLLLDEVFAVGDEEFQTAVHPDDRSSSGRTARRFCSCRTRAPAIRSICDRVCLLDHGRLLFDGGVERGLDEYQRVVAPADVRSRLPARWRTSLALGAAGIESCRAISGPRRVTGPSSCFGARDCSRTTSVLDVGCGSLATGRHLLDYLEPARYWGFDVNHALMLAGVTMELPRVGVRPDQGFFVFNHEFDLSQVTPVSFAIAEGFFSRLPLNRISRCIASVLKRLAPAGAFTRRGSTIQSRATSILLSVTASRPIRMRSRITIRSRSCPESATQSARGRNASKRRGLEPLIHEESR